MDHKTYRKYVVENRIDWILHLPALLSATCEANIGLAMQINIESSHIAFRIADEFGCKLFIPSSIGAFGPASPLEAVPDVCYQRPHTGEFFRKNINKSTKNTIFSKISVFIMESAKFTLKCLENTITSNVAWIFGV